MDSYNIIKVNATKSTNDKVKMLIKSKKINHSDLIYSKYQYKGRGQTNNRWYSSYNKNLLCSLYYDLSKELDFTIPRLNFTVGLSVFKTISFFSNKKISIKWPNDILAENKKISGILIENKIKSGKIIYSIIGVGININQTQFKRVPNATSLKKLEGKEFNSDHILNKLIENFKLLFSESKDENLILKEYNKSLFGKVKCKFSIKDKVYFGKVVKVIKNGNLLAEIENIGLKEFKPGEIKILV